MKQSMRTIATLAMFILTVLMVSNCDNWSTDPSNRTGTVAVTISLQGVGQLSKISEIDLSNLYLEMTSGSAVVSDTISVTGNSQVIVSNTYTDLTPGEWTLTAETLDDKDSTIHEGSTTFTVIADQTTEVSLDLASKYSMLTANFIGIPDSVSYLGLLVDAAGLVADTSFTQGSEAGNTVSLEYDYLETGISQTIQLDAYGSMYGTYQPLYTGDTTITVIAGVDISYTISLVYVGPAEATGANASVIITVGRSGRVTVNGNFPNESDGTMTDIDGNVYTTITIGDQVWMAENLKVTHYRNGDAIPHITDNSEWSDLTTGAYCAYDNNSENVGTYGRLYNWYAVDDSRNIAPEGWHVPTDEEWQTLVDYLGGASIAGGKMKEAGTEHWTSPNAGATNGSGFTALPGGYRYASDGNFLYMGYGYDASFWSATGYYSSSAWGRLLHYNYSGVGRSYYSKTNGFSVRLVRDSP